MAGTSTIYDVAIRYDVVGNASVKLKKIADDAHKTAEKVSSLYSRSKWAAERTAREFRATNTEVAATSNSLGVLKGMLIGVGAMAGGMLLGRAKQAFIDFNASIEQSAISLATTHQMFKGGTWASAMQVGTDLFEHYQDVAKKSVGTTKDFLEMHQTIAASAYQAGASLKDIKTITQGAVIAGQALGETSFVTSMDIKQALTKGVEVRDRFMNVMLASQRMTMDQFNKLNKSQRIEALKKMLDAPTIKNAAATMEKSFSGVTSTLQDNLSIAAGKVGLPLFKAITAEVQRWNTWIEQHPKKMQSLVSKLSTGLHRAFETVRKIVTLAAPVIEKMARRIEALVSFLYNHQWIVKTALLAKGAWTIGQIGAGAGGALAKLIPSVGNATGLAGGLAALSSTVLAPTGILAAMAAFGYGLEKAAKKLNEFVTGRSEKSITTERDIRERTRDEERTFWTAKDKLEKLRAQQQTLGLKPGMHGFAQQEQDIKDYTVEFERSRGAILQRLYDLNAIGMAETPGVGRRYSFNWNQARDELYEATKNKGYRAQAQAERLLTIAGYLFGGKRDLSIPFAAEPKPEDVTNKPVTPSKSDIKVTINKIEVASEDPDRFVFGLQRALESFVRSPSQAEAALRGGF